MISTEEFAERRSRAAEMADAEGLKGLLVCSRGGGTLDRFGDVFYLANYYTSFPYIPDLPHVWSARAHTFVVLSAKGDCILVTDAPNDGQTALAEENVIYTDLVLDGVLDAMQRLEMESGSVGLVGGDVLPAVSLNALDAFAILKPGDYWTRVDGPDVRETGKLCFTDQWSRMFKSFGKPVAEAADWYDGL